MEIKLYRLVEVVSVKTEKLSMDEFVDLMILHKPTGIFNTYYSSKSPCWHITEYIHDFTIMYYAHSYADKTPRMINLDDFYRMISVQGLASCHFVTD